MAFLKTAKAVVVHPRISGNSWNGLRKAASKKGSSFTDQAKTILGGPLDPQKYLFTHCTIVGSVDVEEVPGVKLGSSVKVGSATVNRPYSDYYIKPTCSAFVNNNGDSWSREVLLKSYRTFIGAHNFQEHVQIEEQSKGRVIDAVARDIGDSVYIDILVATDRKHGQLVQDIESGKMATLSMGCTTEFTVCSNCGNFAADETQLCDHIRYAKLNTFLDDGGKKRVIAELCGHPSYDETGGVTFIEASWVATPAFTGAVMRNILTPGEVEEKTAQIEEVFSRPPESWSKENVLKAAKRTNAFGFGGDKAEEGGEAPVEEAPLPFQDLEDALYNKIKEKVQRRIEDEMEGAEEVSEPLPVDSPNDNIIKEASSKKARAMYRVAMATILEVSKDQKHLLLGAKKVNDTFGVQVNPLVYPTAFLLGPIHKFGSLANLKRELRKIPRQKISSLDLRMIIRLSTLLSHWETKSNHKSN